MRISSGVSVFVALVKNSSVFGGLRTSPTNNLFFDTSHQEWELLLGRGRVCVTKQPYLFDEDAHVFVGELHMQLQDKTGMLVVVNARERDEERRPSVIPAS